MSVGIGTLAVIGVGLIGGSLARALRAADYVEEVIGCGRSKANLEEAVALGVIDRYTHDAAAAAADADVVFLAVPLGAMREAFAAIFNTLPAHALVTDAGSAKGSVVADCRAAAPALLPRFIPGHPIAGTEKNGVAASLADLYQQRRVILTPLEGNSPEAVARVREMWQVCGAEVSEMSVAHHDEVLAATSHLPHMLAFGLVDMLARLKANDEIFRYAAGGFRDFTRIASSNPVMWRDICIANRKALGPMLAGFAEEMNELALRINSADADALLAIFERAKAARDRYVDGL
ncbi:MAG: prephenate dehydrogenase/arogenate dehydrogenase family protein [Sedimenticolaceae bacterium]